MYGHLTDASMHDENFIVVQQTRRGSLGALGWFANGCLTRSWPGVSGVDSEPIVPGHRAQMELVSLSECFVPVSVL